MNKCAFYGSLRKNLYNHARFVRIYGEDKIKYLRTTKVSGFKLYNLGAYPAAVVSNNDDKIVVDLFELTPEVYRSITNMELGAGYGRLSISVDDEVYTIFTFNQRDVNEEDLIPSGDYSLFCLENNINL